MGDLRVPKAGPAIEVEGVSAVHVTLRFEGLALGQGIATLDNPLAPIAGTEPTDVMALMRSAMEEAIGEARRGLEQLASRPGNQKMPRRLEAIAPLLRLEVAIARAPQRVRLSSLDQLPHRYKPGLHGLALRDGKRWSWVFPDTAVSANLSMGAQLRRLAAGLNLGQEVIREIGGDAGPTLYRFSVEHVVRPGLNKPMVTLHRGSRPIAPIGLSSNQIDAVSKTWATYLMGRQDRTGRFSGTYQPTSGRFEPARAPLSDAALACYALARQARVGGADDATRQQYEAAAGLGLRAVLEDLGVPHDSGAAAQTDKRRPTGAVAMTLMALLETRGADELTVARDRLGGLLLMSVGERGVVRSSDHRSASPASRPTRALVALALVRLYERTRDERYMDKALVVLGGVWSEDLEQRPNGAGPWLAMVEVELSAMGRGTLGVIGVRKLSDAMWSRQVRPLSLTASGDIDSPDYVSPDTIGGFALTEAFLPEPTWMSAGPVLWQAVVLGGDQMVTDEEKVEWMMNTALGLRFLSQLTMRAEDAYYAHQLNPTVGGVRVAPWDNRQPLGATAMALLAASEFTRVVGE